MSKIIKDGVVVMTKTPGNGTEIITTPYRVCRYVPSIGNFPGYTDEFLDERQMLCWIHDNLDELTTAITTDSAGLLNFMDLKELTEISNQLEAILKKFFTFKHQIKLQMKAKLLFENEASLGTELSEEEMLEYLNTPSIIDQEKLTIERIIRYCPELVMDNCLKNIEDNAKKEESRGSSNSINDSK